MKITEIKNNFAKVLYRPAETKLVLSDFLTLDDDNKKICAQVISIESTSIQSANQAVVKFCFNIAGDGTLSPYSGYVPSLDAKAYAADPIMIQKAFSKQNGAVCLGELTSGSNPPLKYEKSFLDKFLYIQSDRASDTNYIFEVLLNNLKDRNCLIFDLDGTIETESESTYEICKNFKLPINIETLNYIYENDLSGLTIEQKAIVQDIILDIQEYIKSEDTGYIPFSTLLEVVDDIYQTDKSLGIILFRNKLLKYHQYRLFASKEQEFDALLNSASFNNLTILKLNNVPENWRKEAMSYVIGCMPENVHYLVSVSDETTDVHVLEKLFGAKRAAVASAYSCKFANHLKSLAKNLILFAPEELQKVYPTYNSFLSKLSEGEFVITGDDTLYTPLIIRKLSPKKETAVETISPEDIEILSNEPVAQSSNDDFTNVFNDPVEQEIAKDVDSMFVSVNNEQPAEYEQVLSDDDLDFLDDINSGEYQYTEEETQEQTPPPATDEFSGLEPRLADEHSDFSVEELHGFTETEELQEIHPEEESVQDITTPEPEQYTSEPVYTPEPQIQTQDIQPQQHFDIPDMDTLLNEQKDDEDFELLPEDDEVEDLFAGQSFMPQNRQEPQQFTEISDDDTAAENLSFVSQYSAPSAPSIQKTVQNTQQKVVEREKPTVPVYTTNYSEASAVSGNQKLSEGNVVYHEKYGRGVVEQIISYGKKTLCSIQFDNVGRRLLDPKLADLKIV